MNYFDIKTPVDQLQEYLVSNQWIKAEDQVLFVDKPGEGNMNVVLRIKTDTRSFILKQSRPFVQKYQEIEAPLDRIAVENQFYQAIQKEVLSKNLPAILGYDATEHLLILEDLGDCQDLTSLYSSRKIAKNTLEQLTSILSSIHKSKVPKSFPDNMAMRQLNHQHIFVLPFLETNGFELNDIQEGLQELSMPFKQDTALKAVINDVGNTYLSSGNTLIHGDYYPGSWMTEAKNIYVIDPEFGFVGFAEFDLGVMAAHIIMATADESYLNSIFSYYTETADKKLMIQVAGIEIIRRIIGIAQLPLERSLTEKKYFLELARKMILS